MYRIYSKQKTMQVRNIHAGSVEFTGAFRKDLLVGYSVLKSIAFDQNEHVFGRMNQVTCNLLVELAGKNVAVTVTRIVSFSR